MTRQQPKQQHILPSQPNQSPPVSQIFLNEKLIEIKKIGFPPKKIQTGNEE